MGKKEPKPKTVEEFVESGVLHTSLAQAFTQPALKDGLHMPDTVVGAEDTVVTLEVPAGSLELVELKDNCKDHC